MNGEGFGALLAGIIMTLCFAVAIIGYGFGVANTAVSCNDFGAFIHQDVKYTCHKEAAQ